MRYGKFISENKEKQSDSSKEKLTLVLPEVYHLPNDNLRVPQLNVLGKIDLSKFEKKKVEINESKDNYYINEALCQLFINQGDVKKSSKGT